MAKSHIDFEIIQLAANALDCQEGRLMKGQIATNLTTLFENSPHSGRGKPGMLKARLQLAELMLGTLRRLEIEDTLRGNCAASDDALATLAEIRAQLDSIERMCRKPPEGCSPRAFVKIGTD